MLVSVSFAANVCVAVVVITFVVPLVTATTVVVLEVEFLHIEVDGPEFFSACATNLGAVILVLLVIGPLVFKTGKRDTTLIGAVVVTIFC